MGSVNKKVVSIYGNTYGRAGTQRAPLNSAQIANISAAIKSISTMHLTMLLRAMFDDLDDTLFAMSDESVNENKKSYYCDEIHELRLKKKQVEILFIKRFEELFSQSLLFSPFKPAQASRAESLKSFLDIDDAELESSIMLTHFIAKANKNYMEKMNCMQVGFDCLMKNMSAAERSTPVAPALIGDAFKISMQSLDSSTIQKTIVYDHFDQDVMQKLGGMYDQINALFVKVELI